MKTERRHELQTNYLANRLAVWIEWVKPYSSVLTLSVILALAIVVFASYFSRRSSEKSVAAWDAYFQQSEAGMLEREQLLKAANDFEGTAIEDWALLAAGDAALQRGAMALFRDKKEAARFLNAACDDYRALKNNARSRLVQQRAAFSLAMALESHNKIDDAVQAYRDVQGTLAEAATQRVARLEKGERQRAFYDWFASAKLPVTPSSDGVSKPGTRPLFEADDPSLGSFLESSESASSPEDNELESDAQPPVSEESSALDAE